MVPAARCHPQRMIKRASFVYAFVCNSSLFLVNAPPRELQSHAFLTRIISHCPIVTSPHRYPDDPPAWSNKHRSSAITNSRLFPFLFSLGNRSFVFPELIAALFMFSASFLRSLRFVPPARRQYARPFFSHPLPSGSQCPKALTLESLIRV